MRTDLIWHLKHNHESLSIGGWWSEEISEYLLSLVRGVVHRAKIASIIHPPDHGREQLALLRSVETEHPLVHRHRSSDLVAHTMAGNCHLSNHNVCLLQKTHRPLVDCKIAALVLAVHFSDGGVCHKRGEHLAPTAKSCDKIAVKLNILPPGSH